MRRWGIGRRHCLFIPECLILPYAMEATDAPMPKTTSFILGEHFDSFVASQIETGRYASASEIIREGLRLVENRDRQMEAMDEAIHVGLNSGIDEDFSWEAVKAEGKAMAQKSGTS